MATAARKIINSIEKTSGGFDLDDLLSAVVKDIKKDFADVNVNNETELEFLSTGNTAVNYAISGKVDGGFPVGWMTELAGLNATGKTLLALHALVETQKQGGVAILIDSEFAFNPVWYKTLGGDPKRLIHYEPDHIESVYQFIKDIVATIRSKNREVPITIVYDSIAASPSKYEVENDVEKHDMGKRAIAHGKGIRLLMRTTRKQKVTFIGINQYRKTLSMFGPDMETTGGMSWDYGCSVRVHMKKGKIIVEKKEGIGDIPIGIHGSLRVQKNRCRAPFAEADFDIYFTKGIDPISGLFDVLTHNEVIEPAGKGWWQYKDEKFQRGKFAEVVDKYPELLGGHEAIELSEDITITDQIPESDKTTENSVDADM